jgi:L-2-hydroxyglutarate oxidase
MTQVPSTTDFAVVGAGIVGLATAMKLQQRFTDCTVRVVEAESRVSAHQSGHNSGVLHSGIYYQPGSAKAICCRTGKAAMEEFCDQHKVAWDRCGKVVVATNSEELPRLDRIAERATANGVDFERIDTDQLRELEPASAGIAALHVPETGIVNYRAVCEAMAGVIRSRGGLVDLDFNVRKIDRLSSSLRLTSDRQISVDCGRMVNCGGLQSDRVCRLAGGHPTIRIIPFRGEYYELEQASESLCRNLIYPVPDPSFPFLGVHFTRMIEGGVECGPNAVFALSRKGYRWSDINVQDLTSALSFGGFRKLAVKHWRMGAGEIHRSLSKAAFVKALQKLIPSISSSDLKRGRAGVRAQAVTPQGDLVDDFLVEETELAIHVLNAPSPAATASLAIADMIVDRVAGT